jgi:hypothetical protein
MTPVSFIIIVKVIYAAADTLLLVCYNLIVSHIDNLTEVYHKSSGEGFLDFTNSGKGFDNLWFATGI